MLLLILYLQDIVIAIRSEVVQVMNELQALQGDVHSRLTVSSDIIGIDIHLSFNLSIMLEHL